MRDPSQSKGQLKSRSEDAFTQRMRAVFRSPQVPESLRARIAAMLQVERRLGG